MFTSLIYELLYGVSDYLAAILILPPFWIFVLVIVYFYYVTHVKKYPLFNFVQTAQILQIWWYSTLSNFGRHLGFWRPCWILTWEPFSRSILYVLKNTCANFHACDTINQWISLFYCRYFQFVSQKLKSIKSGITIFYFKPETFKAHNFTLSIYFSWNTVLLW